MESVSKKGTCIALSNIDVNKDPIVIQPCPIPGTGIFPVWSSDGQHIISINLREWNKLSDLILLEVPNGISTYMEVENDPKVILSIFAMIQSTIWIHPNIFLVIDEPLYPDPYKIIVFNIEDNCILQTIDIPRGASEPDWLPA